MIVNSTNDGLLKLDWKRALRKIYLKKKDLKKHTDQKQWKWAFLLDNLSLEHL